MREVHRRRRILPGGDIVETTGGSTPPGSWTVRRMRPTFFGLKEIASRRFSSLAEAEAFAEAGADVSEDRSLGSLFPGG